MYVVFRQLAIDRDKNEHKESRKSNEGRRS